MFSLSLCPVVQGASLEAQVPAFKKNPIFPRPGREERHWEGQPGVGQGDCGEGRGGWGSPRGQDHLWGAPQGAQGQNCSC